MFLFSLTQIFSVPNLHPQNTSVGNGVKILFCVMSGPLKNAMGIFFLNDKKNSNNYDKNSGDIVNSLNDQLERNLLLNNCGRVGAFAYPEVQTTLQSLLFSYTPFLMFGLIVWVVVSISWWIYM